MKDEIGNDGLRGSRQGGTVANSARDKLGRGDNAASTLSGMLPDPVWATKKQFQFSISIPAFQSNDRQAVNTSLILCLRHQSVFGMISRWQRFFFGVALLLGAVFASGQAQADDLYVGNYDGTISKITSSGNVSFVIAGLDIPRGLTFDCNGNLFVAHYIYGIISRISKAGVVSAFAKGMNQPYGEAFDSHGDLYVADAEADRIVKVTNAGVVSTFVNGLIEPNDVAFDSSGTLFVAGSNGTIFKVLSTGQVSIFAIIFHLGHDFNLAFNEAGDLFITNTQDNSILKVTKTGAMSVFAKGIASPNGLAFDSHGDLFVASGDRKIFKISPAGAVSTFATGLNSEPNVLAFERPLPPPPKPTPAATPPADPQAELKIAVKDMARSWRNDDWMAFVKIYAIPGEFDTDQIKAEQAEEAAISQDPRKQQAMQQRHEQMAQVLDSLANLTPTLNANGYEATYTLSTPSNNGPPDIRGAIVLIKINGKWYLKQ